MSVAPKPFAGQHGFTLLELMITITVLVILMTIGVPSYQSTVRNNCAVSGANSLLSIFTVARSEAQRRGRTVTVCPGNSDGTGCATSGTAWEASLVAFVDTDKNHKLDSGEELIRSLTPLSTCSAVSSNFGSYISFDSLASPNDSGTFTITPNNQTDITRKLKISRPSKIRICNPTTDSTCT